MLKTSIQNIPDVLIYEMDGDKPVYYHGYRQAIENPQLIEKIMGSSVLQALIIELIKDLIKVDLGSDFIVLSNEVGIQFTSGKWRNADIAVFDKKELFKKPIENKYATIPPRIVIEVDTKAALEDYQFPEQYYHQKTDELLGFGVKQVLWIFTSTQKFTLAQQESPWETKNWEDDVELNEGIVFNLAGLLSEFDLKKED